MIPGAERIIVALDAPDLAGALAIAKRLQGVVRYVKIGSVVFTADGPPAVARMRELGFEVFLDLKFHDIPSTVEKSCQAAARQGIWMLTVHATGEREMLAAAAQGAREGAAAAGLAAPKIVGVTVLTSVGSATAQMITSRAVRLAAASQAAGLNGVVASAGEAKAIRKACGAAFTIVCPGIRGPGDAAGDQARTFSAAQAVRRGADYLVIGRPITQAVDPRGAVERLAREVCTT